jgi:tetratricopeptide (TPR) repeat protein
MPLTATPARRARPWAALALLGLLTAATPAHADGDGPRSRYAEAYGKYRQRHYRRALEELKEALQLDPGYGAALQLAGNCYYALGDGARALGCYLQAQALLPLAPLGPSILRLQAQGLMPIYMQLDATAGLPDADPAPQAPAAPALAPAAAVADPDEDDSEHYDEAKSRLVKIMGPKHKAFLYDPSPSHTLDHVLLCADVQGVEFLTDAVGKAWRIILRLSDGTKMTYDQDGAFMFKSRG